MYIESGISCIRSNQELESPLSIYQSSDAFPPGVWTVQTGHRKQTLPENSVQGHYIRLARESVNTGRIPNYIEKAPREG